MPEIITDSNAQYALDIVKAICTEVGPGLPGSAQERERAAMIERELASHLGAGNVVVEEFTLAPGAFLGSLPASALCMLVAALLNISVGRFASVSAWLPALAALASSILSVLLVFLEYIRYYEFIDPLFKNWTLAIFLRASEAGVVSCSFKRFMLEPIPAHASFSIEISRM